MCCTVRGQEFSHARAKEESDHAGWCGYGAPRRASSVSFLLPACLRASILRSAGSALCSSLLHDQLCVVAKLTPVALLFMYAPQVEPSPTSTSYSVGVCLWVTDAPGTGKTTFVKEHIIGAMSGTVNLDGTVASLEGRRRAHQKEVKRRYKNQRTNGRRHKTNTSLRVISSTCRTSQPLLDDEYW